MIEANTQSKPDVSSTEPSPSKHSPHILSEFLTREELASQLGISARQLWWREKHGCAPPKIRLGRRIYFARSTVVNWIMQQQIEAPTMRRRRRQMAVKP